MDPEEQAKSQPTANSPIEPTDKMRKDRVQQIGPFRVKVRLGQGGMGTVYLCSDPGLDRLVAVKVLREDLRHDSQNRERFLREARAIAQVSHPNVVQIYQVEPGERPFFAMEYVQGKSVAELLREKKRFPVPEACRIVAEAAEGLKALHRAGIVHRDITPNNILIDRQNAAKLVDFGLASDGFAEEEQGVVLGTAHYVAPEQVDGDSVDERADIYGLGATLYHMLTGDRPFGSTSREKVLGRKLAEAPPLSVKEKCPEVPGQISDVVQRMLQPLPGDRYENVEEVVIALRKATHKSRVGHLVLALAAALCAGLVAYVVWPERPPDLGGIQKVMTTDGSIPMNFPEIYRLRPGLTLGDFVKSARTDGTKGPVPTLDSAGLLFSDESYDVVFPPIRLDRVRLSGLQFDSVGRWHLGISFGHPEELYRSFSFSLRDVGEGLVFRVVEQGSLRGRDVVLDVGKKLQRCLLAGFDMELTLRDGPAATVLVTVYQADSGEQIFKEQVPLPESRTAESWRNGVVRLKLTSLPRTGYTFRLASVRLRGTIDPVCIENWIVGNDRWRSL